ncbi:uncharacterized protein LACBIDRAFT_311065 [Laccaria bicolor S238N-H82]|uniref:Predicted protein n=1 Tax=Laccaria bicolor (strain S238N-H82 / ATCC MYA-4686) TaxID=486041 RepID=B0CZ59_LACBS|nr:uncharacterized protein LACBIDRAFT_311065 [Laccaria bicolor S238N-H82]EDR12565.1 predicted protein [Laccaria bicolor S238N-H82]|eukprot:XP_001876829.1 predicted protein [Laccaria bicolor S238N-H82]
MALKPASAPPVEAQPTSSGCPHTLSAKQQQLKVDKRQKQAVSKDKAYVQALHGHQAQEAIMGYQSIPVQSPVEADVESEDEDDHPVVHRQGSSRPPYVMVKLSVWKSGLVTGKRL